MTDTGLALLSAAAVFAAVMTLWKLLDWLAGLDDEFPPL